MGAASWWTNTPPRAGPRSAWSGRRGGEREERAVIRRVPREAGEKPARSRHCEWGATPESVTEATGSNPREGRATATIHESGDLIATRGQRPLSREKERSCDRSS